jgi:hypothetical protein
MGVSFYNTSSSYLVSQTLRALLPSYLEPDKLMAFYFIKHYRDKGNINDKKPSG